MKSLLRFKTIAIIAISGFLFFSSTSCVVLREPRLHSKPGNGNNGKHKGWYKGKGNPHGHISATPWKSIEKTV